LCGNCLRYHTPRLAWILSASEAEAEVEVATQAKKTPQ
jgi:hypothetical protein